MFCVGLGGLLCLEEERVMEAVVGAEENGDFDLWCMSWRGQRVISGLEEEKVSVFSVLFFLLIFYLRPPPPMVPSSSLL